MDKTLRNTILLTGIMIVTLFAFAESTARAAFASEQLPTPALGVSHYYFDLKVFRLDEVAAQHDTIDCVVFGSSAVHHGFNTEVIAETYRATTGDDITCFNFALGGVSADQNADVAEAIIRRYEPRTLIFGINSRDFDDNFGRSNPTLEQTPWITTMAGAPSPPGLLAEYSKAFQYYLLGIIWYLDPATFEQRLTWDEVITPYGNYNSTTIFEGDLELRDEQLASIDEYRFSEANRADVNRMIELEQRYDVQVVFIEVPLREELREAYTTDSGDYFSRFIQPVRTLTDRGDVVFIETREAVAQLTDDTLWINRSKLNGAGNTIFGKWLANQLIEHEVFSN